jgi:hypothetical protein
MGLRPLDLNVQVLEVLEAKISARTRQVVVLPLP